jgi:hypothetical protein
VQLTENQEYMLRCLANNEPMVRFWGQRKARAFWSVLRSLERRGLVQFLRGERTVLTDAGRTALAEALTTTGARS